MNVSRPKRLPAGRQVGKRSPMPRYVSMTDLRFKLKLVIAEILADELNECLIDSEAASLLLKKERRQIAHLNALLQKYGLS